MVSGGPQEADRRTVGVDHGGIGAQLVGVWKLDGNLVEAVRWHHRLDSCAEEHHAYAETVQYADSLCHLHQTGELLNTNFDHPILGLGSADAEAFITNLNESKERALLFLV